MGLAAPEQYDGFAAGNFFIQAHACAVSCARALTVCTPICYIWWRKSDSKFSITCAIHTHVHATAYVSVSVFLRPSLFLSVLLSLPSLLYLSLSLSLSPFTAWHVCAHTFFCKEYHWKHIASCATSLKWCWSRATWHVHVCVSFSLSLSLSLSLPLSLSLSFPLSLSHYLSLSLSQPKTALVTGDAMPQYDTFYDLLMAGMLLLEQRFLNLDQDRSLFVIFRGLFHKM